MARGRRRVVREHEFEEQLAALLSDEEEADEYINAAELILAEDPELGLQVNEKKGIFVLGLQPIRRRQIDLYYTFDSSVVVFLWIVPSE